MNEKKEIGRLFDRIAVTYDRINHLMSLNVDKIWRRKAVRCLEASGKVLDVAIGTGDFAIEILRQGKAEIVKGIDLSGQMMLIGERKVRKLGFQDKVSFIEASALEMPFEEASFDAVTCAYGVRNFSDLEKGLSEMFRVLRPGGQLLILEFSYPSNRIIRPLYDFFFSNVMPAIGRMVSKDPTAYTYFKNSVKSFIWGDEMARKITAAGFRDVTFKTLTSGLTTIYIAVK